MPNKRVLSRFVNGKLPVRKFTRHADIKRMTDDAFRERLLAAVQESGKKAAAISKAAGKGPDLVRDLLSGKTNSPRLDTLKALARALDVSPEWLGNGTGSKESTEKPTTVLSVERGEKPLRVVSLNRQITVVGRVEAGAWRESVGFEPDEKYNVSIPNDTLIDGVTVQGLEVSGTSFNKVYPPGIIVIVASFLDLGRDPQPGEVVVVRRRNKFGFSESTLKQFFVNDKGEKELWPCSTDPKYQDPLVIEHNGEDDEIEITGVVIRSIHHPYRGDARNK